MNKKLLLSLGAVVATTAVAAGSTYALFSATKPASTPITAGHLCLDSVRDAFDTVPGPMFYMTAAQGATPSQLGRYPTAEVSPNSPPGYIPPTPGGWAPGDSVTRTLTVYNGRADCGGTSLEAKLISISANWHAGSGSYDPLADKLQVTVLAQPASGGGGANVTVAQGSLRQFMQPGGVQVLYPAGGGHPLIPAWLGGPQPNLQMQFQVNFDLDTPNAYQDKTAIVDFTVYAEQARNNP